MSTVMGQEDFLYVATFLQREEVVFILRTRSTIPFQIEDEPFTDYFHMLDEYTHTHTLPEQRQDVAVKVLK